MKDDCGAIDCVNGCDGDFAEGCCPNAARVDKFRDQVRDTCARAERLQAELATEREKSAEAVRLMSDYARQVGFAKGALEMSEAAGVVDMWREHAEAAQAKSAALEAENARIKGSVIEFCDGIDRSPWIDGRIKRLAVRLRAALASTPAPTGKGEKPKGAGWSKPPTTEADHPERLSAEELKLTGTALSEWAWEHLSLGYGVSLTVREVSRLIKGAYQSGWTDREGDLIAGVQRIAPATSARDGLEEGDLEWLQHTLDCQRPNPADSATPLAKQCVRDLNARADRILAALGSPKP